MYLFLATLGLRCYAQTFSSCVSGGYTLAAVCGLLIAVASLVEDYWLKARELQWLWYMNLVDLKHVGS